MEDVHGETRDLTIEKVKILLNQGIEIGGIQELRDAAIFGFSIGIAVAMSQPEWAQAWYLLLETDPDKPPKAFENVAEQYPRLIPIEMEIV